MSAKGHYILSEDGFRILAETDPTGVDGAIVQETAPTETIVVNNYLMIHAPDGISVPDSIR